MKTIKMAFFAIVLLSVAALQGCGGSGSTSGGTPSIVTIRNVNGLYYRVDIDMSGGNHYDIGRQYALQIQYCVPAYESLVDSVIQATLQALEEAGIDFNELNRRAHIIYGNIPTDYQLEIQGMQSVFSSTDDTVGNGRLSQNKLLIFELAADVARVVSCSASAAFGSGSTTGETIVGRNLEWSDYTLPSLSALEATVMLHNGSKSVVLFGFVGQICAISGFNAGKVFAAVLDSDLLWPYVLLGTERSYVMDVRYALENQTTLQGFAAFMTGKDYAYTFNVILADPNTSAVFEDDPTEGFSGLRTATSTLKTGTAVPIPAWSFSNAIAVVNWFTLPGTSDNSDFWNGNLDRWNSFINLYTNAFSGGGTVNINVMKQITGYPGAHSTGKASDGAIWRYNDEEESVVQSIVMNMNTLETWVSFQPQGQALHSPNYIQVFSGNPF